MSPPLRDSSAPTAQQLADIFALDALKGFGPQKFKQLYEQGTSFASVLRDPLLLPIPGKRGDPIREQLRGLGDSFLSECLKRAEKQLQVAGATGSAVLTYSHSLYPKHVFESNNPVPVLYARGDVNTLQADRTVACVGSRNLHEPYHTHHATFARTASREGFTVVSGFALGADTVGHKAAVEQGGGTICVMPSGLDRPFPPENKSLWTRLLDTPGAVFVSEFPFGTGAASLNLRKRNKTIVAFALGVFISQTSKTGGAMNAYRFALEQKKPIATIRGDGTADTSGNDEMALATKQACSVFSANSEEEYVSWLRTLSSST